MSRESLDNGDAAVEFADERSLLTTPGPAGVLVSERLVRSHQAEVQRAAYLLSGEPHAARWFAERAFLTYFERALRDGNVDDQREQLFVTLATDYLGSLRDGEHPPPPPSTPLADSEPTRFAVEDQRSRVLDALDRLDPKVRTSLVLREFSALPEEVVCQTLELSPYDLRGGLEPARARLRDAAGAEPDAPTPPLLVQATFGEPVGEMWPELEEKLQHLHARVAARRRRLIAGAGLASTLVLMIGAIWLFGTSLFNPDETESQELAPQPTRFSVRAPLQAPESAASPTPTQEPTMPDIPVGNVPDRLLMKLEAIESKVDSNETGRESSNVMYDSVSKELHPRELPEGSYFPSPDGRSLIIWNLRRDESDSSIAWTEISMVDADTGGHRWTREYPPFRDQVMSGDSIYAIEWDEHPSLMALHITTGKPRAVRANIAENMAFDHGQQRLRDLQLVASPDESLLAVVAFYVSDDRDEHTQIISTYALPELELQDTALQTYEIGPDGRLGNEFVAYSNVRFTPDGSALYAPGNDRIQVLPIGEAEPVSIEIPFSPSGESGPVDLRWVRSNDGRYLYVVALSRMEVAVIDLLTKSLDLVAPFDAGAFSLLPDTHDTAFSGALANWGAVLSMDGRHMYLLGGWKDSRLPLEEENIAIWVIDTETWRVADRLVVPGAPTEALWTHGGERLIVQSQFYNVVHSPPAFDGFTTFDTATNEIVPGFEVADLPEWLDTISWVGSFEQVYRDMYGRQPAIGGVRPETVETVSSLPRVALVPTDTLIPSGRTIDLDLRILDPTTGQPLTSARSGVRYDPAGNPLVILRQRSSATEQILVPMRTAAGEYSGIIKVDQEGVWDAEVRFETGSGEVASVNFPEIFDVTPSIPGDGGERYTLQVQAEPGSPIESEEWTIRASFVDVESGGVIPEGKDLESELPEKVTVRFTHPSDGFVTATLDPVRHGIYEGKATFPWPGTWDASGMVLSGSTGASVARLRLDPVVIGRTEQ